MVLAAFFRMEKKNFLHAPKETSLIIQDINQEIEIIIKMTSY